MENLRHGKFSIKETLKGKFGIKETLKGKFGNFGTGIWHLNGFRVISAENSETETHKKSVRLAMVQIGFKYKIVQVQLIQVSS